MLTLEGFRRTEYATCWISNINFQLDISNMPINASKEILAQ